jgi:hypothetical protein
MLLQSVMLKGKHTRISIYYRTKIYYICKNFNFQFQVIHLRKLPECYLINFYLSWTTSNTSFLVANVLRLVIANLPITVTVFSGSNNEILGLNPTRGRMSVCFFCVCVVLCAGSGHATGWPPVQWVLPTLYRIKKLKLQPRQNKGPYSHNNISNSGLNNHEGNRDTYSLFVIYRLICNLLSKPLTI